MDDLQIIELYFVRDEHAIKETDSKYGKLCFRVAKNILFDDEDSEECVNDTFLTVWNKIPPTRPGSPDNIAEKGGGDAGGTVDGVWPVFTIGIRMRIGL